MVDDMDWFENNYAEFDMMGKGGTSKFQSINFFYVFLIITN